MWAGSHTDLLSGKSVFIDIHWIHLMNQHSALLCTVHVVDDVAQTNYRRRSAHRISGV